ncbi:MAG: T9SS type A sorting domain-containing protein [Saprospiraceae bacterium]|nr:T9SS type A sorting domain-containing protein [Saprospiraceae bacterium]
MKNLTFTLALWMGLTVVSFGQIAAYSFNNGNANDESANGYNAVVEGAMLTTDRFGNPNSAYEFDGTDSINCGFISELSGASTYSISCWLHQYTLGNTEGIFSFYDNSAGSTSNFYQLRTYTDGNLWGYAGGFAKIDNYSSVFTDSTWHHLVVTFDDAQSVDSLRYRMYVDGVAIDISFQGGAMSSLVFPDSTTNFIIGKDNPLWTNGGQSWNGKIDDFYIYDIALTPNQIDSLYNVPNPNTTLSAKKTGNEIDFIVYPNPVDDILQIRADQTKYSQINILDLTGRVVSIVGNTQEQIDVSGLVPGIYLIKLVDRNGLSIASQKIIKE